MNDRPQIDKAYHYIRELIAHRQLQPDDRIPEDRILTATGVSREDLLAAITRLVNLQVIVADRDGEPIVAKPPLDEMQKVYAARAMLEPGVFRMAAGRRSEQSVQRMRENLIAQDQLDTPLDMAEYAALNREFHMIYIREAKDPNYEKALSEIYDRICIYELFWGNNKAEEDALETHRAIYEAFDAGDGDTGSYAVLKDIVQAEQRIREYQE